MEIKNLNRLIREKSDYLLQHAYDPVDWYPWGKEPFERAKDEDKPVFISIGYSSCHWCHVMREECFKDQEVAALLNKHFISIKVDKEERPDINTVYMDVCQMVTGSGGWPLSIFATSDGKPFFAGTYIPKKRTFTSLGFVELLVLFSNKWKLRKEELLNISYEIQQALKDFHRRRTNKEITFNFLKKRYSELVLRFDKKWGGFGVAPKFPMPHVVEFLLDWYREYNDIRALEMAEKTLLCMSNGGIFDHVGGGFHRYSVDERWHVPHFEKMLIDQALISTVYLKAYKITQKKRFLVTANKTLKYVLDVLEHKEGGFYCAEDSSIDGEEGDFYTWKKEEILRILPELGEIFCKFFGVTNNGNFKNGKNVIYIPIEFEEFIKKEGLNREKMIEIINSGMFSLYTARNNRKRPFKDKKVLASYNGLMIAAFAIGADQNKDSVYLSVSRKTADFVLKNLLIDGVLYHMYKDSSLIRVDFLEDYAFFIWGLLVLYKITKEDNFLKSADKLAETMVYRFWDEKGPGFFISTYDPYLPVRPKIYSDGAAPSPSSFGVYVLSQIDKLICRKKYDNIIKSFNIRFPFVRSFLSMVL